MKKTILRIFVPSNIFQKKAFTRSSGRNLQACKSKQNEKQLFEVVVDHFGS